MTWRLLAGVVLGDGAVTDGVADRGEVEPVEIAGAPSLYLYFRCDAARWAADAPG